MRIGQLAIFALGILVARPVAAGEIKTDHFTITYENITPEQAHAFAAKAERAFADVTGYLDKTYGDRILIDVSDGHSLPHTKGSTILIPANRIRGDAPGPERIRGRGPAIAHEITHVVAPSAHHLDRLLDEGLGVYVQEKFGGDRSYPNMGRDVHDETASLIGYYGRIIPLEECEKVRLSDRSGVGRSLAYLQEGSFVRFLIERHGLEPFMRVYDGKGSYDQVYGKSFKELEMEWVAFIKSKLRPRP